MSSLPTTLPTSAPQATTITPPSSALPTTLPGTTSIPISPPPPSAPSSSPSTTSSPSTSTTPSTTPTTTTTTPSATTAPSSSTSPSNVSSSSSPTSSAGTTTGAGTTSTTPTSTSMTSVMTTVPTTIMTTNAVGSTVFITSEVSTFTAVPTSVNNSTTTSSNTGAIVGGVIGAIALVGLVGLLFFCLRRRRRKNEFDGNFDPDRVVSQSGGGTLPQVDLGDEHEITPLPYPDQGGMRQYGDSPYLTAGAAGVGRTTSPLSSPSHYSDAGASYYGAPSAEGYPSQPFVRPGPQGQGPGAPNMYAMQQGDWHNPQPMTSPPPSVSNTSSSGRAMKEREAMEGRQGLGLATQQETDGEGSGVVQHQDAGRAPGEEEGEPPRDIPPSYDSIRQ